MYEFEWQQQKREKKADKEQKRLQNETNQKKLYRIALTTTNNRTRYIALDKLTEQSLLVCVANNKVPLMCEIFTISMYSTSYSSELEDYRPIATSKLTDKTYLEKIITNSDDNAVREAAKARLKEL